MKFYKRFWGSELIILRPDKNVWGRDCYSIQLRQRLRGMANNYDDMM